MIFYQSCRKELKSKSKKIEKKFLTSRVRCDNLDWLSKKTETSGNSLRKKVSKKRKKFLTSLPDYGNLIWLSQE